MKIGILTLPFGANYGGILQNWALQQALIKLGHTPVTILHQRAPGKAALLANAAAQAASDFLSLPAPSFNEKSVVMPPELMRGFIDAHIACTPNMAVFKTKTLHNAGLEAIVVGSDQVWRRGYNIFTQEMFLRFVNGHRIKRIAYAASFGNSDWNYPRVLTSLCRRYLKRFDAVSCREHGAADFCRDYFGVDATVVCDPTMLIDRADYEALCSDIEKPATPYLLAFVLDDNGAKQKLIEEKAKSLGLEVRYVRDGKNIELTIPQWLAAFRDASCVITDSFHGTVFSIIFQKPFLTLLNFERGAARFDTLKQFFDIGNRFISTDSEINDNALTDAPDCSQRLTEIRANSLEFIKKALF